MPTPRRKFIARSSAPPTKAMEYYLPGNKSGSSTLCHQDQYQPDQLSWL